MARPLCVTKLERASIRSSAAAAASALRGGVRNIRSAQAPASSGKSSAEAANRTFVLILGRLEAAGIDKVLSVNGGFARRVTRHELLEGDQRALASFPVA